MRLIQMGKKEDGWSKASETVFPLLVELPRELVETEAIGFAGHAKLTAAGETILDWT